MRGWQIRCSLFFWRDGLHHSRHYCRRLLVLPGVISPVTNTLIILPFRYASLAFLALILTSCGLAAINADDIWYFASGGVIGSLLSTTLQPLLHSSGGTIALLCVWAAGLTLFTGWSWVTIAEKLGGWIFKHSHLR
ncbi:DNA translocase FtsK 4TM domain-containing protein [Escherichia coli]